MSAAFCGALCCFVFFDLPCLFLCFFAPLFVRLFEFFVLGTFAFCGALCCFVFFDLPCLFLCFFAPLFVRLFEFFVLGTFGFSPLLFFECFAFARFRL